MVAVTLTPADWTVFELELTSWLAQCPGPVQLTITGDFGRADEFTIDLHTRQGRRLLSRSLADTFHISGHTSIKFFSIRAHDQAGEFDEFTYGVDAYVPEHLRDKFMRSFPKTLSHSERVI